jgi:hypothetical protein
VIAGNDLEFEPAGEGTMHGEPVLRYRFRSVPGVADWTIQYGKLAGRTGEEGFFVVDSVTLTLREVTVQAVDVPRNLPLKTLSAVINYEPETISGRRVLLPETAQVNVQENSGIHRVSRIFFDHCRAFGAESTVSFEQGDSPVQSDGPGGKVRLPAGLDITVALTSPVSPEAAAANDVVTAQVAEPVRVKGREIIARGAGVEGHVRLRRGEKAVRLELDRVQTMSGWAPFYAQLLNATTRTDPEIPGVAEFPFANGPAPTRMVWRTESLAASRDAHAPQLSTTVEIH